MEQDPQGLDSDLTDQRAPLVALLCDICEQLEMFDRDARPENHLCRAVIIDMQRRLLAAAALITISAA